MNPQEDFALGRSMYVYSRIPRARVSFVSFNSLTASVSLRGGLISISDSPSIGA